MSVSSLANFCTVAKIQAALPSVLGLELDSSSVTANTVSTNDTATSYCNVTMAYNHAGQDDRVVLWYTLPDPSMFANRFYVPGGFGYYLGTKEPTDGLAYGAVTGSTDLGYDGWTVGLDSVILAANSTINWDPVVMFGYKALGETTLVGKPFTKNVYSMSDEKKLYSYFEGCSDGGRQAMSQVQRFGAEYDGVVAGAPAFRHAHQQINHLTAVVTQQTMNYYPPPCEIEAIVNATVAACDPLDGRTDGVVGRPELCKQRFDVSSTVGTPYSCAATTGTSLGFTFGKRSTGGSTLASRASWMPLVSRNGPLARRAGTLARRAGAATSAYQPAQDGTVTQQGADIVAKLWDGLLSVDGKRAYLPWPISGKLDEAAPTWSNDSQSWGPTIPDTGGVFATKMVELLELDNLPDINNVTYDTLIEWMNIGYKRFADTLQTTFTDLSEFQSNGGKLLHYHGEMDNSVPPTSSIRYHEAVRRLNYPHMGFHESTAALDDFYRLFMIPGAGHCNTNNGPFPSKSNLMQASIDWVEKGIAPDTLNATVTTGSVPGETQQLCKWPLRMTWTSDTTFDCRFEKAASDSFNYDLTAFKYDLY